MGDKCPPLRLPIHVETSCGSKNDCGCNKPPIDNCAANCTINETISFQGTFQENCCKELDSSAALIIAYLSNVRNDDCQPDYSLTLNPICLDWCDFIRLFYRANNAFSILPTSFTSCAINFAGQKYENTTSRQLKLNLAQLVREAWASKCETTVDKIPPKINILLNRESSYIRT